MAELAVYDNDPTIYLFTSLTAGSSHIVTATSRIETILRANKIPFKGVDTATDDLARKLFQRRAQGKKLPLIVKEGYVLGDLEMIEEWNEYDELHEALGVSATHTPIPAKPTPAQAAAAIAQTQTETAKADSQKENSPQASSEQNLAIRQLGAEAAKAAAARKQAPVNISTTNPLLTEKVGSPATAASKGSPASGVLSPKSPVPSPGSGSSERRRSFAGADVEDATAEEIRKFEQEAAIAEVSSSEEVDSEDERPSSKSPLSPSTTQARTIPSEADNAAKDMEKLKLGDEQEKAQQP